MSSYYGGVRSDSMAGELAGLARLRPTRVRVLVSGFFAFLHVPMLFYRSRAEWTRGARGFVRFYTCPSDA